MSAKGQGDPGEDHESRVGAESPCSDMKRAAAKKIERYFYQLREGCGNPSCDNQYCASSGNVANLTANEAAGQAISLFAKEARLCDGVQPSKVARTTLEPGPASLAESLPNKNVNPTCSVEEIPETDPPVVEQINLNFPVDYSSETDDKNVVVNLSLHKNSCDAKIPKRKHRKRSSTVNSKISKKKTQRKTSQRAKAKRNLESSVDKHQLINKLLSLALYLRYVNAKQFIAKAKTKN